MKLGDSTFDLVVHAQTVTPRHNDNPAVLGERLRTMYPKFRGSQDVVPVEPEQPGTIDLPTHDINDAAIRIVAAFPNPPGPEDQGEWVELRNVSEFDFDLAGWRLTDAHGRPQQ